MFFISRTKYKILYENMVKMKNLIILLMEVATYPIVP